MGPYEKLKELLLGSDLGEAEVALYLSLLKNPAENIYELIVRVGLSKSAGYRAFEKLEEMKMVASDECGIKAQSLKVLVAQLKANERKLSKTAYEIRKIAPFLHLPEESMEEIEHFYTPEQVREAYMFMANLNYDNNLDFGDFESFAPLVGGFAVTDKFREARVKHAAHRAICTTFGPYASHYCTRESEKVFKNKVQVLKDFDFKNRFVIFSDTSDYVLFNDCADEDLTGVLVKSKVVADAQRAQFENFSQQIGKSYG